MSAQRSAARDALGKTAKRIDSAVGYFPLGQIIAKQAISHHPQATIGKVVAQEMVQKASKTGEGTYGIVGGEGLDATLVAGGALAGLETQMTSAGNAELAVRPEGMVNKQPE
jgi:hypothetical protein